MFIESIAAGSDKTHPIFSVAARPGPENHAIVIGRHTLAPMLGLMKAGCASVETHAIDAPVGHLDPVSIAWITDVRTDGELTHAIGHAAICVVTGGYLVLDTKELDQPSAVAIALNCLTRVGFQLLSVLREQGRAILVAARRPREALAT